MLDLGSKAGLAVIGVGGLMQAGSSLVTGLLSGAGEMERYETQLTTLMGSAEGAKGRLEELAQFGASTPFELPELVRAEKVLQGFGLTGQKAFEMTGLAYDDFFTRIGDISAGVGKPFEEVALGFAKLSSGASGEAISRFQELGIATKEQMAALGVEFDKAGSLMSPIPVAMQAIMTLTEGKFAGGMDKLSATFEGRMSSLSDAWGQFTVGFGNALLPVVTPVIEGLTNLIASPEVMGAGKAAGAAIGGAFKFIADQAGTLKPVIDGLQPAFQVVSDSVETFKLALSGEWANAEGINPITAAVGTFATSLRNDVIPAAQEFTAWAQREALPVIQPIAAGFMQLAGTGLSMLSTGFQAVMRDAGPFIAGLITQLQPALSTVGEFIQGTVVPGLQNLAAVVGPVVGPAIQHMGEAFANMSAALGPIGAEMGPLIGELGNLGAALMPIAALVGGVMIAGFVASWEVMSGLLMGVPTVVKAVVQGITAVVGGLADVIGGVVGIVTGIISGDWTGAWNSAGQVVEGAWRIIEGVATAGAGIVVGVITGLVAAALNIMSQLQPGMATEMQKVKDTIVSYVQSIDIAAVIREQMNGMIRGITESIPGIAGALGQLRALFPSSPAETGPWSELPDWESAFSSLDGAMTGAQSMALDGLTALKRQFDEQMASMPIAAGIRANIAAGGVTAAVGGVSPASAANPAKPARTMPETITITVPIELNGNSFGIGPNGTMAPEDMKRLAELLAPAVLAKVLEAIGADDEEGE